MNKIFSVAIVYLAVCSGSIAAEITFPDSLRVNDQELNLAGTGILSRWFIKGCKMGLYVPKAAGNEDLLKDIPKCLEFYYYRDIKAEQFGVAAWETMQSNWTENELSALKNDIDKLHEIYRDVSSGDRYKLLYIPETGTSLFLNGQLLGTVKGAEFAKVYYSIWLGDKPIDSYLKKHLTEGLQ